MSVKSVAPRRRTDRVEAFARRQRERAERQHQRRREPGIFPPPGSGLVDAGSPRTAAVLELPHDPDADDVVTRRTVHGERDSLDELDALGAEEDGR
jgi:hypothetical protein